jgi:hypothetical protein
MGVECTSCGANNREGARFCRGCGHRLTPAPAPVAVDTRAAATEGWPITEPTPLPEKQRTSSPAGDEKTVAISRPPAPRPAVRRPAPVPPLRSPPPLCRVDLPRDGAS